MMSTLCECISFVSSSRLARCAAVFVGVLCYCNCGAGRQRNSADLSSLRPIQSEFTFDPFNTRFVVPFPDNGACGSVGVFDNPRVGVVIDEISADGAAVPGRTVLVASLDGARTVIIHSHGGYVYLVYGAELDSFTVARDRNFVRFALPIEEDHVPTKEIVIRYRVRCADSRLTEQFILRGRNGGL